MNESTFKVDQIRRRPWPDIRHHTAEFIDADSPGDAQRPIFISALAVY